jgi:hypothetical protein
MNYSKPVALFFLCWGLFSIAMNFNAPTDYPLRSPATITHENEKTADWSPWWMTH